MNWWQGLVLGIVQGLTEFLPVSSSGHLVVAQALIGFDSPGVAVEVLLHVATLLAVVIVYRRRLITLLVGLAKAERPAVQYTALIVIATIPAGIVGITLESTVETAFGSLRLVGVSFLLTGFILWSTRFLRTKSADQSVGWMAAIVVGFAQAVAVFPGISRSGATIVSAMWFRVSGVQAAEFSFLMAIPAIGGAALLQVADARSLTSMGGILPLGVSFLAALVSGVFAIKLLVYLLRKQEFHQFAGYCWLLGLVVISWSLFA